MCLFVTQHDGDCWVDFLCSCLVDEMTFVHMGKARTNSRDLPPYVNGLNKLPVRENLYSVLQVLQRAIRANPRGNSVYNLSAKGRGLIGLEDESERSRIYVMNEFDISFPCSHFWIDFICINQSDLVERGHQVNMMKDIYGTFSYYTIAWFGEPEHIIDSTTWNDERYTGCSRKFLLDTDVDRPGGVLRTFFQNKYSSSTGPVHALEGFLPCPGGSIIRNKTRTGPGYAPD